ncbi:MAG: GreA/GreB family elongation factor [Bacteroidota bacterium]
MSQTLSISPNGFLSLLENLIHIEENLKQFSEFSLTANEANNVKKMLEDYIMTLNRTLEQITMEETSDDLFPYVVIGSEVTLQAPDGTCQTRRIISPLFPEVLPGDVSFLSPLGKVLLLKEVNDTVTVTETPEQASPENRYTITSIKLASHASPSSDKPKPV